MAKKKKPFSLKDITPFKLQSTLVKQAGLTSKYSGGDAYTGYGEIDVNKMMDPMKDVLSAVMNNREAADKTCTDEQKEACVEPKVLNKDCKCVDKKDLSTSGSGDTYNQTYISPNFHLCKIHPSHCAEYRHTMQKKLQ